MNAEELLAQKNFRAGVVRTEISHALKLIELAKTLNKEDAKTSNALTDAKNHLIHAQPLIENLPNTDADGYLAGVAALANSARKILHSLSFDVGGDPYLLIFSSARLIEDASGALNDAASAIENFRHQAAVVAEAVAATPKNG